MAEDKYEIVVQRVLGKSVDRDKVKSAMNRFAGIAMKGDRGTGWTYTVGNVPANPTRTNEGVVHSATVIFKPTTDRESVLKKWPRIVKRFAAAGAAGNAKKNPWTVISPKGYEEVAVKAQAEYVAAEEIRTKANEEKELGEVNLDPGNHFARLFARDAQIRRVLGALEVGKATDWNKRKNCLLSGEPGGGKTELMIATRNMLGKEGEAYLWFDATSFTKAGVLELLMSSPIIPPVLFIEEIEKCVEEALRWLLGIMDIRGEIRRLNYRVGHEAKNVRMVVIASANDVGLLKRLLAGALYSRFQSKIYCPHPDKEIMRQILRREVEDLQDAGMDANETWIEPAITFAYDKWGILDPREVIDIMSIGGERLLTGEAQDDLEETMAPEERLALIEAKKDRKAKSDKLAKMERDFEVEMTAAGIAVAKPKLPTPKSKFGGPQPKYRRPVTAAN